MTKQIAFTTLSPPVGTMALTEPPVIEAAADTLTLVRGPTIVPAPDTLTVWLQRIDGLTDDDLEEVETGEDADQVYGPDEPFGDWTWTAIPGVLPYPLPNEPTIWSLAYRAEKAGYPDLTFRTAAVFSRRFAAINGSLFTVTSTQVPVGNGSVLTADTSGVDWTQTPTGTSLRAFYVRADGSEEEILPPPPPTLLNIARVGSWAGAASTTVAIPEASEAGVAFVVASGVGLVTTEREEAGWTILGDFTAPIGRRMVVAARATAPGEQIGTWPGANRIIAGLYTGVATQFGPSGALDFPKAVLTGSQNPVVYPALPASGTLPAGSWILALQASIGSAVPFPEHVDLATLITEQTNNRVRAMEGQNLTSVVSRATSDRIDPGLVVLVGLSRATGV